MSGIQETKEVLSAAAAMGNGYSQAIADGKIGIGDIGFLITALVKLPAALSGIDKVPEELQDLDDSEKQELIDHVKNELNIDDNKAEKFVERGFEVILTNWQFVNDFFIK